MTSSGFHELPVGSLQEGLWMFWVLNPMSPAYTMPELFFYEGDFDQAAATFAINSIIARHEILRTTYHESECGAIQRVHESWPPVSLSLIDLTSCPSRDLDRQVRATVDRLSNQSFDLTAEPPIRAAIIRLTEGSTALVINTHHIAVDGASIAVIVREFGEHYNAASQGDWSFRLPAAPGYGEYLRTNAYSRERQLEDEEYWGTMLSNLRPGALPGRPVASGRLPESLDAFTVSSSLGAHLTEQVRAFARAHRLSEFSVLLCAMQSLIAKANGTNDVSVGIAVSGRPPQFANSVGAFVNLVVVRSNVDLRSSFASIAAEVSGVLMDAIDHSDLPFMRVAAKVHDSSPSVRRGIVRTAFASAVSGRLGIRDGLVTQVDARTNEGPFDLVVVADVSTDPISMEWEFAARTYPRDVAVSYVDAFSEFLQCAMDSPHAPTDTLTVDSLKSALDALALDDVDVPRASKSESEHSGPLDSVERLVGAIWASVLNTSIERADDDFFILGGHSMLASKAIALIRKATSRAVPLRLIFERSGLRDFCDALRDVPPNVVTTAFDTITPIDRSKAVSGPD